MRVGTRFKAFAIFRGKKDHPHACGDKCTDEYTSADYIGSSPCVWGQGVQTVNICRNAGIIPMRVGTSDVKLFRLA